MPLSTTLFGALVRSLAPKLSSRDDRDYFLDMALYEEAAQVHATVASDVTDSRVYTRLLLRFLDQEYPRPADGWSPLLAYLETVQQEFAADEALADYVEQVRLYEEARRLAREAGLNPDAETLDELVAYYLDELVFDFEVVARAYVDLEGSEQVRQAPPRPRSRRAQRVEPLDELGITLGHVELDAKHCRDDQAAPVPVGNLRERLLTVPRAVLLGEPGSGKSWTLRRLALDYAAIWRGERRDPVAARPPPVPVFVELRDYNGQSEDRRPLRFADFVARQMGVLAPYLDRLLRERRLVFLADALNEMPRQAPDGRDLVAGVRAYLRDKPAFVVSCRVRDYRDDLADLHLEQFALRDLTPPQIREVLRRRLPDGDVLWEAIGGSEELLGFWAKVVDRGEGERFWDAAADWPYEVWKDEWEGYQAWRKMHQGSRLIPLCRSPFMAYLLCRIYGDRRSLPSNRVELFASFLEVLFHREAKHAEERGEPWPERAEIEAALVRVARAMQQQGGTVLPRADVVMAAGQDGAALLEAAIAASVLVEEQDTARGVGFSHQLLQEYFAARTLLAALEGDQDAAQFFGDEWWDAGAWRETVVILGEVLDEGILGPNRAARWLAPASPEVALEVILRHGSGLGLDDVEPATRAALVASAEMKTGESDPLGRAAAFRVLSLFDADHRPGLGVGADGVPEIDWVALPDGRFAIGGDPEAWKSLPAQEVELPAFRIARYPVTNAQFRAFLDAADGYRNAAWWRGLAEPEWESVPPRFPYGNHPREMVNWYEAVAFCRWLSARLGYEVRLPTEVEWERTARGAAGRPYPWGEGFDPGRCNARETGIGQTSAVGLFPGGATPEGVHDLAGDVWEWTLTTWEDGRDDDLTSPAARVVRGGSWFDARQYARAASRVRSSPNFRGDIFGFRVVAPAPARSEL